MSRLTLLARHPRRTIATLATVLAAGGGTAYSGADFTAQSANPSNAFSSGTLTMSNSAANAAIFSAANLRPGAAPSEGTVDIANTGTLAGDFTVTRGTPADSDSAYPLSGKLNAIIDDCGAFNGTSAPACGDGDDITKYTGTVADMGTAGHPAPRSAPSRATPSTARRPRVRRQHARVQVARRRPRAVGRDGDGLRAPHVPRPRAPLEVAGRRRHRHADGRPRGVLPHSLARGRAGHLALPLPRGDPHGSRDDRDLPGVRSRPHGTARWREPR